MDREWGWFKTGVGKWEKRKYDPREETPGEGPPEADELWCGGTGNCRELTDNERTGLFIQTGKDFGPGTTLRDVEKYGREQEIPFRIHEQDDKKRIADSMDDYKVKVTKEQAGKQMEKAKKILTASSGYAKSAQDGGMNVAPDA